MAKKRTVTAINKLIMNTRVQRLHKWIRLACVIVPLVFAVTAILNGLNASAGPRVGHRPKGQTMADLRTLLAAVDYMFGDDNGFKPITPTTGGLALCVPPASATWNSNQPAIFSTETNQPVRG